MCESVHVFVSVNGLKTILLAPLPGRGRGEVIYFFSEG